MRRQRRSPGPIGLLVTLFLSPAVSAFGQAAAPAAADPAATKLGTAAVLPVVSWQDAGKYVDREVYVVGKIVRTGHSRTGHVFLNFDADYRHTATIFVRSQDVKNFPESPEKLYYNKLIKIRGFPYERNGQINISLGSPDRISILPDGTPLPAAPSGHAPLATRPALGDTITVGSYNVLNLFDAVDDPYTYDDTTGPKSQAEVEALAKSIRSLNADVLALVEVENRGVLQQFVDLYLADMGYEVVLFEGNDTRGIDNAVLSRVPVGAVTSHRHLRFPDANGHTTQFQRDLLEVRLEPPKGTPFELFVVHLKSKGGDDDNGLAIRMGEARAIRGILDRKLKADPKAAFLIAGDYNDTLDSEPLQTIVGSGVSKLISFVDDLPANGRVTYNQEPYRSMIDFIFASPAMGKRYVAKSYQIPKDGAPDVTGSDHNPVIAQFRLE